VNVLFTLILHLLLIGTILALLVGIVLVAFRKVSPMERLIRTFAMVAGVLVAFGANAAGVDFARFSLSALEAVTPEGTLTATLVPGAAGIAIGTYLVRSYRKSRDLGVRVMSFLGMLAVASFMQVYAVVTDTKGFFLGAAAIPNVAFVVGIILSIVLQFNEDGTPAVSENRIAEFAKSLKQKAQKQTEE
jgi:hypothetical protein